MANASNIFPDGYGYIGYLPQNKIEPFESTYTKSPNRYCIIN